MLQTQWHHNTGHKKIQKCIVALNVLRLIPLVALEFQIKAAITTHTTLGQC